MQLAIDYALLQYGGTIRYEKRRSAEPVALPAGELHPPFEHWLDLLLQCQTFDYFKGVYSQAQAEVEHWRRRPDPPPEGETLVQMIDRLIEEAEGWSARDAAVAFRCSATQIRRWRQERERNPETGSIEGSLQHARDLLRQGLSLRQVAILTGIPKSTLHDAALKE